MLAGPGMDQAAQAPPNGQGSQNIDPREQVKGAMKILSDVRGNAQQAFSAIATQFPAASGEAQAIQTAIDQGVQRLLKKLLMSVEMPEPSGPDVLR